MALEQRQRGQRTRQSELDNLARSDMLGSINTISGLSRSGKKLIENKERTTVDIDLLDPAPNEWNGFPAYDPLQMAELKMSVQNNGVLDPIIVWKKDDGRYMILAGHNRTQACKEINEENKGKAGLKYDYSKIPALVFEQDELTEEKAREIIIDTNYIARGKLPSKVLVWTLCQRVELMKKQQDEKGRKIGDIMEELSRQYDVGKSQLYERHMIGSKVIPEIQQLYFDGKISSRACSIMGRYDSETQQWVWDELREYLTTANIRRIREDDVTRAQIAAALRGEKATKKMLQIKVPEKKYKLYRTLIKTLDSDPELMRVFREYMKENCGVDLDEL